MNVFVVVGTCEIQIYPKMWELNQKKWRPLPHVGRTITIDVLEKLNE